MKKFFCLLLILAFSFYALWAEESLSEETEKTVSEDISSVSETSTIYESSSSMLEETESSQNIGLSFFAKTVKLIRNIPLAFDVGLEGASNGTVTYASAVYSWSPYIHTRLNFEYEHSLGYEDGETANDEIQITPMNYYNFQFFPFEQHVFFNRTRQSQFSYGLGIQYLQLNEVSKITGWLNQDDFSRAGSSIQDVFAYKYTNETKSHLFGPLARCYFRIPLTSFIVFNSETLINPINAYLSNSEAKLYLTGKDSIYSRDNNYSAFFWTYTDIKETVHFDFFNLFAFVFNYSFRHAEYDYYDLYNKLLPINSTSVNQNVFKVGVSLINVGKTNVRLKSGLYYEHKWTKNMVTNLQLYEGKWTLSLGLDF